MQLPGVPAQAIEYKFVVLDSGNSSALRWEGGGNRVLAPQQVANAGGHPLLIETVWIA